MKRLLIAAFLAMVATSMAAADSRSVRAVYVARLSDIPAGTKTVTVWIPLPSSDAHQTVSGIRIDSPFQWTTTSENRFGNRYAFANISNPPGVIETRVEFEVTREVAALGEISKTRPTAADLKRALEPNRLVTVSPRIRKLADEITSRENSTIGQARAIFDYVVSTMKYDKSLPGWGKGDTERACDIRAGNCTDFHSLFISLARAKGIPARFVIGFPMPDKQGGEITGYHCWAEFYVDGLGWVPVDASEAWKSNDPVYRNFLFGNLDADRVAFTMGRDLTLVPRTSEPLNYFIYPHAEANGKAVGAAAIALEYRTLERPAVAKRSGAK